MKVFYTKKEISEFVNSSIKEDKTLGYVPTMGALHHGHGSLIEQSIAENQVTIVSIFVNPTQFDNRTDLNKYPRTLENDIELIKKIDASVVIFAPSAEELYANNVSSKSYSFDGLEHEMEGKHRQGHFDGVGTVLDLFFNLIKPTNAYFGEKDFQQLQIVKKLVSKLKLNVNVVGCDIFRESSGLAMSSRNERLSKEARIEAAFIFKTLKQAKTHFGTKSATKVEEWVTKQFAKHTHFNLEYVSVANVNTLKPVKRKSKNQQYRLFIAVFIDNIRLIDNIALN
ncbi:MAG: pantoate--beta-alanine ligase [Flavobacteriaceae bacterium]